jgi:hypothetical protein
MTPAMTPATNKVILRAAERCKYRQVAGAMPKAVANGAIKLSRERGAWFSRILEISQPRSDEPKDHCEQNREDDRCHDREIDADISFWTLVFDVTWKK